MDSTKMGEKLVRIETQLDQLLASFEKVSNGVGFPRCSERGEKIRGLEKSHDQLGRQQTWLSRVVVGAVIIYILKQIWTIGAVVAGMG